METMSNTDVQDDESLFLALKKSDDFGNEIRKHPEYMLRGDTVIGIPKRTFLRRDSGQVAFYGNEFLGLWGTRLNSAQAVVIALFDGKRTLDKVSALIQDYAGGSKELNDFKVRRVLVYVEFEKNQPLWLSDCRS